jgi:hypothetical protein
MSEKKEQVVEVFVTGVSGIVFSGMPDKSELKNDSCRSAEKDSIISDGKKIDNS